MLGLKHLPMNKLTTAFMVISAALVIFAATAPADNASTTMLGIWILCALFLIGVWSATAYEIYKRFFGGQSPLSGSRSAGDRSGEKPRDHRYHAGP